MKHNYKTLFGSLAVAALLTTALPVNAAPGTNNAKHKTAQRRTTKQQSSAMKTLAREMNLTEAQQTRIEPILRATVKQVRAVRSDKSLSQQQEADRLRQIQSSAANRVNAILNANQRKKFTLMLQQMRRSNAQFKR